MKAITIPQPWASLVAAGVRPLVSRAYEPLGNLVGERIGIHADDRPVNQRMWMTVQVCYDAWNVHRLGPPWVVDEDWFPLGAIVATARLAGSDGYIAGEVLSEAEIVQPVSVPCDEGPLFVECGGGSDYSLGGWSWRLEDIRLADPPIPTGGHPNLWDWAQPERA